MSTLIRKTRKTLELGLRYSTRILGAKNHFNVPFRKKLKANFGGGYLADQYILYDFDNNDKREYLSEFDWYKSRYINEPFNDMLDNKVICTEVLGHYVKVPEIYVGKNHRRIIKYCEDIQTYEQILELLHQKKQLFIKPISAGKGKGVYLLSSKEGQLYVDETPKTPDEMIKFLKKDDNWIITETISQHAFLNEIYDRTTNTIRLITMRDIATNEFKVFFAVQRIGTSKTIPVDNGSRGGLVAKIDLETGSLSHAKSLQTLETHVLHPDSRKPIEGVKIPNWEGIKQEVLELANRFPFMNFIAWDILPTDEGICIIEANTSSGVNIIQLWGGQRQKELGDFYRHHGVIK